MIGFYNYTVILTYMGLISSVLGIYFACGIDGSPNAGAAVICLMVSGLCDMFDGKVARTRERTDAEKKFGIQIDSLSDLICFSLLPSVIGYSLSMKDWYWLPILIGFPLCGLIRLAYFNVMEEERQKTTTDVRKVYEGLPVTSTALLIPLVYSFHNDLGDNMKFVYAAALAVIAIAFISPFKIKKPGLKGMLIFTAIGIAELIWIIYKF